MTQNKTTRPVMPAQIQDQGHLKQALGPFVIYSKAKPFNIEYAPIFPALFRSGFLFYSITSLHQKANATRDQRSLAV